MLSDLKTYEIVKQGNPVTKVIEKQTDLLKRWLNNSYIDYSIYKRLCPSAANLSRAYALPQIHKKDYPYRLIVFSIGSPFHKLSKYLPHILSSSMNEESYSVKNSFELLKK